MQWFRLYGDMPTDPKIGTLNDADFRTWIELLCSACKSENSGITIINDDNADWALRRNVTSSLHMLLHRELIGKNNDGFYYIKNWEKRQPNSSDSTIRVRKFREKQKLQKSVTLQKRYSNGLDKRRIEKNREDKKENKNRGSRFTLTDPPEKWIQFCNSEKPTLDAKKVFMQFHDYWTAIPGQRGVKLDWFATWKNWIRNQKDEIISRNTTSPIGKSKWISAADEYIAKHSQPK